jgi:hypothetical protein
VVDVVKAAIQFEVMSKIASPDHTLPELKTPLVTNKSYPG